MLRSNLPRAVRELRRRNRWRQAHLASRCGVSRQVISRIERGQLGSQSIRTVARVVEALDATAELVVRWHGEELDRLMDRTHAVQQTVSFLQSTGWATRVEVSFNHFGDRGRVDVLAFHPGERILAVVEVKSALRGRRALGWVRSPSSPSPRGLLWFVRLPDSLGKGVARSARVRVDRNGP